MGGKPDTWMPLYVGDYLRDTQHLSAAQSGAYLHLIMHYWVTGDCLNDCDSVLWRIAKADSLEHFQTEIRPFLEPFFRISHGKWRHKRVDEELAKAQKNKEAQRVKTEKARAALAAKRASVKGSVTDTDTVSSTKSPSPSPSPSKESSVLRTDVSKRVSKVAKPNGAARFEIQQAVDLWNALADDIGLPRCAKLTETRRTKLRNRLIDAGGLPGWEKALERIRGDPFFRGDNKRGWRAGIDFLLRESSFTKLMEGYYDFGRQEHVFDAHDLARRAGIAGDDSDLFSAEADVRAGIEQKGDGSQEH
ncbi:MAG: YdaU family protein [Alphaproteobacteria bacterium]